MYTEFNVTEKLSDLDYYDKMGMALWVTPNTTNPYWATNARWMYDKAIANPFDFLDELGYDFFDPEADYEEDNPEVTITVGYWTVGHD